MYSFAIASDKRIPFEIKLSKLVDKNNLHVDNLRFLRLFRFILKIYIHSLSF